MKQVLLVSDGKIEVMSKEEWGEGSRAWTCGCCRVKRCRGCSHWDGNRARPVDGEMDPDGLDGYTGASGD